MSQTALVTQYNIRVMIDDLDHDAPAISTPRMAQIIRRKVQLLAARTFQPLQTPTTIALVAGTFDYTLTGTPASIRQLILNSDGVPLERMSLPQLNATYRQDTAVPSGNGTPRHYAIYELSSQATKVRIGPTPAATDTIDLYYDIIPGKDVGGNDLNTAAADIPFSTVLLAALEKACASECVMLMDEADRARRKLSAVIATAWGAEAESLIAQENWRMRMYESQETVDLVNPN